MWRRNILKNQILTVKIHMNSRVKLEQCHRKPVKSLVQLSDFYIIYAWPTKVNVWLVVL